MTSETWFLVLSVLLWGAIIGWWTWWVRGLLRRRRRVATWPRVQAEVVESSSKIERVSVDGRTERYEVFTARYAFTDPAGVVQRGERRSRQVVFEGDPIEVMHDPADPTVHESVARPGPLWPEVTLAVFFSLCVGLFAVITGALGLGFD